MVDRIGQTAALLSDWQEVLASPQFFLHSINVKAGTFGFIHTDRLTLSKASFIDGRSALNRDKSVSNEVMIDIPIEHALSWHDANLATSNHSSHSTQNNSTTNRFIFHMSFCGSTLLARTLDISDRVFSYKEPQIFLQLAEIKAKQSEFYINRQYWKRLLSFVMQQFNLSWKDSELTVVKPSNWLNSMLPDLLLDAGDSKAALLYVPPEEFLASVFRGGGERVQYNYSVMQHLLTAFPEYKEIVSQVEMNYTDVVEAYTRYALITHSMQSRAFFRLGKLAKAESLLACSYQDLINNPELEITKIGECLELNLSTDEIKDSINHHFAHHSKITDREFDNELSDEVNAQVMSQYKNKFENALEWSQDTLYSKSLG